MYYFENTKAIIEKFNAVVGDGFSNTDDKELDFIDNIDFEMARALIFDWDQAAIKIAKMILAHYDINDIKIKIE